MQRGENNNLNMQQNDETIQLNVQTSDEIHYQNQSEQFIKIKDDLDGFLDIVKNDDILQEQEEIYKYLNCNILENCNGQEKREAIQYLLKQKENKLDFLNCLLEQNQGENQINQFHQDDIQFYQEARRKKEYLKIFHKFSLEPFLQVNKIPIQISSNRDFLEKMFNTQPEKITLLFDYYEFQEKLTQLTQIELLQLLIQLIDNPEEKFQQIIGSISKRQCSQFQTYIDWIQIQDQKQNSTIENQLFLKGLLSLDLIKIKEDLMKFITQQMQKIFLNNLNPQINCQEILRIFGETLQKQVCCNILIDQIYFAITFYFWLQHCQKLVNFHQQIKSLLLQENDNRQKENILKTKINIYQKENPQLDEIHQFLLKKILFYNSDLQSFVQLNQNQIQEQNDTQNILIYFSTMLDKYFNQNDVIDEQKTFLDFWEQLQQLQFYQIIYDENNLASKYFIQMLWINHQDDIIFQILKEIPKQESELINFLQNLEDLNKKRNYQLQYLTLDILELIIMKNNTNCQTIKIFRDQFEDISSFLCIEDCIKLYTMISNNTHDIIEEGIKILQEIFCKLKNKSEEKKNFQFLKSLGGEDYGNQFLMLYNFKDNIQLINLVIKIQFFKINGDLNQFKHCCEDLFMLDESIYNQCYEQFKDNTDFQITPLFFKHKKLHEKYPTKINVSIEQFLLSRTEKKCKNKIEKWINNLNKNEYFLPLLPFLFDIIKRGESIDPLLDQVNKNIENENIEFMNFKVIFQILYNNSDNQLKTLLLKYLSFHYSIPFLYSNSNLDKIQVEEDLYLINPQIYFFIKNQYSIINLSFSKNQSQIGKTQLINKIFYRRDKFSIQDTIYFNKNTIDLMLDCEFSGSRNLLIADTHGYIPQIILQKILPLFSFWIIQMDTEEELNENLSSIEQLNKQIKIINHTILFIVRNSRLSEIDQNFLEKLKTYNIQIKQIKNLASKEINNQLIQQQIKQMQKYIFQLIMNNQEFKPFNKQTFKQILKDEDLQEIEKLEISVQEINLEVSLYINQPEGFFNKEAFPQRYFNQVQIQLKQKLSQLLEESNYYQTDEILSSQSQIEENENNQITSQQTKLIKQFYELIKQEKNYISYLYLTQTVYDLNKDSTQKLLKQSLNLQNQIHIHQTLKKEDKQGFNILKLEQEEIEKQLEFKYLNIDIFWRELINQSVQMNQSQEVADQMLNLLMKGESFELLDGEQFNMNINFFGLLVKSIEKRNKNNKILVIGILGPQSSGKSTILNKIFGCHFFSSVGKSTKGIYFQLIQVKDKQIFESYFDYILIIDTEGLQSPNQKDPLFDKRISLFIFAICDIIIINVKGEINSQFKNLVEICIYSLAQIQNALSNVKQISWCFNQNIDTQNKSPFIDQLKQLTTQLFHEDGQFGKNKDQQQSILELIEIKNENIQILSTTTTQETWNIEGSQQSWTQLIPNESYSKDAYNYGIRLIETYLQKCKIKQQNFNGQLLENFFLNTYKMWETISKLPDLLEFSELIQIQQNQLIQEYYNQLWNNNNNLFSSKQQIVNQIKQEIDQHYQTLNSKSLQEISEKQEQQFSTQCDMNIRMFEEKLKQFKEEKNIQKEIYLKFITKSQHEINNLKIECIFLIQQQVKNYEINFLKRHFFIHINEYLSQLKYEDREKLQNDEEMMKQKFEELWNKIIQKYKLVQKNNYHELQTSSLKQIKSYFPQYLLNIQDDCTFQKFFHDKINSSNLIENEGKEIFFQYQKQLLDNQFERLQTESMHNINFVSLSFKQKVEKSKGSFLDFYELLPITNQKTNVPKERLIKYFDITYKEELRKAVKDKQKFDDFLEILTLFSVQHNYQNREELRCKQNTLEQFLLTIQCKDLNKEFLFSEKDEKIYGKYLKSTVENPQNNIQNQEINAESQNIIINSLQIDSKFDQNYLKYIRDPKNTRYKEKFAAYFNDLLNKNDKWIIIYCELYDQIKIKMEQFPKNIEIISKDLIQDSVQIIIDYIENNYYKLFSLYGLQLSDIGLRCILYYSIHIIWRFYCLRIWKQLQENEQQLEKGKEAQWESFKFQIQQDNFKLSQQRGKSLANHLIEQCQKIFYQDKRIEIENQIRQKKEENKNLVEQLDELLLTKRQPVELLNKTYEEQVVEYLTNQLNFIQSYVEVYINKITETVQIKYQKLFNEQLENFFNKVKNNAIILSKNMTNQLLILNFFKRSKSSIIYESIDQNQQKKLEIELENILFDLVFNYILEYEQSEQEINEIDDQYKEYFIHQQYNRQVTIHINYPNQTDKQINHTQGFLQSFLKALDIKYYSIKFDLNQFLIYENLNQFKITMIGCKNCCPMCNRKCDSDPDLLPHSCLSGHYLRGMKGILLGNSPSLQSCEDIYDDQIINIQEANKQMRWKDIKKLYSKWNFKSENKQKIKENKIRLMKIWNQEIGQLICNKLNDSLSIAIDYKSKKDIKMEQKKFYIFILDDSFSMEGQKEKQMIECLRQSIIFMKSNKQAKISVISFNYKAKLQIEFKKPKKKLIKQIILTGGMTNFDPPFQLSLDQINKFKNKVNKIQIMLYTDGEGKYPQNSLKQYMTLDEKLKNKISFVFCTAKKNPQILSQMVEELKSSFNEVLLKQNVQSQDLSECWNEVLLKGQLDEIQ